MRAFALCIFTLALLAPAVAASRCFDVSNGEPQSLEGVLSARIFAGPPNFEDVQSGDTPEPGYVLTLDQTICLTGDPDFTDPTFRFNEVQLVPTDATRSMMRTLRGDRVFVTLENLVPAHTGHHHRPLVAWVSSITAVRDITQNYGTAATTVEGFYAALSLGDGDLAASFVIPEKTDKGPFSPVELTRFYGNLRVPLSLIGVERVTPREFIASYHFVSNAGTCNGRAQVFTEARNGRNFIRKIKALNGC